MSYLSDYKHDNKKINNVNENSTLVNIDKKEPRPIHQGENRKTKITTVTVII